jgi:hypothetical protein
MKYAVHVYACVRVKFVGVEAADHAEALDIAERRLYDDQVGDFLLTIPHPKVRDVDYVEFQDDGEPIGFLVDEMGDEAYIRSVAYNGDRSIVGPGTDEARAVNATDPKP